MISAVRILSGAIALALIASSAAGQTSDPGPFNLMKVPPPETLSPAGRKALSMIAAAPSAATPPVPEARKFADGYQAMFSATQLKHYKVRIETGAVAGVPVRIFYPLGKSSFATGPVLINLHGGGFMVDSGSMTENIPIAALTGLPVVAVLYRMAPEHPFPAAVDDAVAVYRELLKHRPARQIGLFGTSAGAILTAQTTVRLRTMNLPQPGVIGFFSGTADFSTIAESETTMPLPDQKRSAVELIGPYLAGHDVKDPALSPIFADLKGFPPTLLVTSTRDVFLSHTALFARALQRQGVEPDLVVFEGLPHAFWSYLELPESDEAFRTMAAFFTKRLAPPAR